MHKAKNLLNFLKEKGIDESKLQVSIYYSTIIPNKQFGNSIIYDKRVNGIYKDTLDLKTKPISKIMLFV